MELVLANYASCKISDWEPDDKPILYTLTNLYSYGWRRSAVVSALPLINVVNRYWVRLLLGWVTACGQVNRLGV